MEPSSKKIKLSNERSVSEEFPNEVWTLVLGRLETVPDFSRAQRVSHTFQTIIRKLCWIKIQKLKINLTHQPKNSVSVLTRGGREQVFGVWPLKTLLLVRELARKASKITSLQLDFGNSHPKKARNGHLQIMCALESAGFKLEELSLRSTLILLEGPSFSGLVSKASSTLKTLELNLSIVSTSPSQSVGQLLKAFKDCHQLTSIQVSAPKTSSLDYKRSQVLRETFAQLMEPVFTNKAKLETLILEHDCRPLVQHILTGAHLKRLHFLSTMEDWTEFLYTYQEKLEELNIINHSLLSVRELHLPYFLRREDWMDLFPQLENFTLSEADGSDSGIQFSEVVENFLTQNKDKDKRVLECHVMNTMKGKLRPALATSFVESLEKQLEQFPCQSQVEYVGNRQIIITKNNGNATIKITVYKRL